MKESSVFLYLFLFYFAIGVVGTLCISFGTLCGAERGLKCVVTFCGHAVPNRIWFPLLGTYIVSACSVVNYIRVSILLHRIFSCGSKYLFIYSFIFT